MNYYEPINLSGEKPMPDGGIAFASAYNHIVAGMGFARKVLEEERIRHPGEAERIDGQLAILDTYAMAAHTAVRAWKDPARPS